LRAKGRGIVLQWAEKGANFRGRVNEKTRFKGAEMMNSLASSNEIHCP